jgi:hypothetical protein
MQITVLDMDMGTIWNGAKVKNLMTGQIKEVFVIPKDMPISKAVSHQLFDPTKQIDLQTILNNKSRFQLVNEDDDQEETK